MTALASLTAVVLSMPGLLLLQLPVLVQASLLCCQLTGVTSLHPALLLLPVEICAVLMTVVVVVQGVREDEYALLFGGGGVCLLGVTVRSSVHDVWRCITAVNG